MRTIKEWFDSVQNPTLRRKLIFYSSHKHRASLNRWDRPVESLSKALLKAFTWEKTPEGHFHWKQIRKHMGKEPELYLNPGRLKYTKQKKELAV